MIQQKTRTRRRAQHRTYRIVLVHWNQSEAAERTRDLTSRNWNVKRAPTTAPHLIKALRAEPPDAIVIDLTRLPSHGRDVAAHLRLRTETRRVPLVVVGGEPEKVAKMKAVVPDAVYCQWDQIDPALRDAIANPPANPVVPRDGMAGYSGTPLPKKLGIKQGFVIALIEAPNDFATRTLTGTGDLPAEVLFLSNGSRGNRDLTIWFVSGARQLKSGMKRCVAAAKHGPVWIAWPKKTSALASDVGEQLVRETGLAAGLVDYKICAIDNTWSGLLFCTRKREA